MTFRVEHEEGILARRFHDQPRASDRRALGETRLSNYAYLGVPGNSHLDESRVFGWIRITKADLRLTPPALSAERVGIISGLLFLLSTVTNPYSRLYPS